MAQQVSDGLRQAIENLARQGFAGTEIHRRLSDGTAGLDKSVNLSVRRVQQIAAEARRDGEPVDPLPDDPDAYTELHLKHALKAAVREIRRITAKQRKTGADADALAKWTRAAAGIRRDLGAMRARSKHAAQSESGQQPRKESTLERLARQAQASTEVDPASEPATNTPVNGQGHTASATTG